MNKRISNSIITLIFILITSCSEKKEIIKGDLAFEHIQFTSSYPVGKNDPGYFEVLQTIQDDIKRYESKDSLTFGDRNNLFLCRYIVKLHEMDLLTLPNVYVKLSKDSIMEIKMSKKEYARISSYKASELNRKNKKVSLELEIEKMDTLIYYSDRIIKIVEVELAQQ